MKQHPDRQPRRAVTVQRRNDDDAETNQDFEGEWIDGNSSDLWLSMSAVKLHLAFFLSLSPGTGGFTKYPGRVIAANLALSEVFAICRLMRRKFSLLVVFVDS